MIRRSPAWWLLLLVIPGVVGLARLRFDVEVLNLLPSGLPIVEGLKLHQRSFTSAKELVLTVQAPDAAMTEAAAQAAAQALRGQTQLVSRALWQPPWRENPEQLAELLAFIWLNQPPEHLAQLVQRLAPENLPAILEATRQDLATSLSPATLARRGYDPLGFSDLPGAADGQIGTIGQGDEMFASADGTFRVVFVKPADALGSYRECAAWLEQIRHAVEEIQRRRTIPAEVRFGYTGTPAFVAEIAGGMERDMGGSMSGTLLVVAGLFWWAHRRLLPLLWMVVLLLPVLAATLALGGLIYGTLNVVSLGFAAILIGLTDDYPAILYQEALDHPGATSAEVRAKGAPGIVWSAVTTASAFLLLNFAGLPGLAQLGTLVALGILIAAVVMLFAFPPIVLKRMGKCAPRAVSSPPSSARPLTVWLAGRRGTWVTAAVLVVALAVVFFRPPTIDHSAETLHPTGSPAYAAMKEVQSRLTGLGDPLWLLVTGHDEVELGRKLETLEARLQLPDAQRWLGRVAFPTALWPRPDRQETNRSAAAGLASRRAMLRNAVLAAGFNEEAFELTDAILRAWQHSESLTAALWPRSESVQWLLEKAAARTGEGWLALGMTDPCTNSAAAYTGAEAALGDALAAQHAQLAAWSALGEVLWAHAKQRLFVVVVAMLLLVSACLWLAFRDLREVLLSFATLGVGFLLLLALMSLLGWSWNLMNLMAAPLLMGASVDYAIHTQLALRRNGGDIAAFRRTTGRALLLAAATTMVGFGSLAWAGNAGLASLGRLCAVGLACVFLVSVGLLPAWWKTIQPVEIRPTKPRKPSVFYRREIWWLGLWIGRTLPAGVCHALARVLGWLYWQLHPVRRNVVIENLLPACEGNRDKARRAARELFHNFAIKVADLWRFENGVTANRERNSLSGWESFEAARARGRGVLLITPHLGNWESGGAFAAGRGIPLCVLTQAEPGDGFTALRQEARARWGIETLVVGENAFAFVEIIRRLQDGATVALLVDRPPAPSAAMVQLFGRPFRASIAAAELARATGCGLVPVCVTREEGGYSARMLPEIAYDRAAINHREARVRLTQEIVRVFEPIIRQHLTQWYHFVPIWPEQAEPST